MPRVALRQVNLTSKSKAEEIAKLERRLESRLPLVGGLIRRNAAAALIADGSPEAVAALARAGAQSPDAKLREMARAFVSQVDTLEAVDAVCRVWYELRHPALDALLVQKQWIAGGPPEVRALSILKVGLLDPLKFANAAMIGPLLLACDDFDPDIRLNLQEVLRNLQNAEARDALCRLLIEKDFPVARAIAIEKGMAPEDPAMRALFFFVTDQWDRYDALDFDQRLLRAAYESADATVRQRVREKLRLTGRAEFLTVVVGQDAVSRVAAMTPDELEFVVGMLRSYQNWERLWRMAFETSLLWSVRILEILMGAGWQPAEGERELLAGLWALREAGLLMTQEALSNGFPFAILQAHLTAPGRINDVAFAPQRPLLAVGTGARKVALWNYQTAQRERVLRGFEHSVGHVTFTQDGNLVCSERSNQRAALTGIYGWNGDALRKLGLHQGQVTALEPVSGSVALSAGRDRDIALWDVASGQPLSRHTLPDWPRVARADPRANAALVLMQRVALWLNLADMSVIAQGMLKSSPVCAALLSEQEVIVGQYSGRLSVFSRQGANWMRESAVLVNAGPRVLCLEVLPQRGYFLVAAQDGIVRFRDLTSRVEVAEAPAPLGSITSLHVSPDESFMAIGNGFASFSLWDLRGPSVAALLNAPLASLSLASLGLLDAFAGNSKLEEPSRRTVTYAANVVRHRGRFDIELDVETPSIMAGEFDIEIA